MSEQGERDIFQIDEKNSYKIENSLIPNRFIMRIFCPASK